jgi:two-component system LytT family response regulator
MTDFTDVLSDDLDNYRSASLDPSNGYHASLIGLPSVQGVIFVPLSEIVYCKGESSQTSLYLSNKKRILVNRTLKRCEAALEPKGFCRIHKSYVINLSHIRRYIKGEGRSIELSDGTKLEVSNKHRESLFGRLDLL